MKKLIIIFTLLSFNAITLAQSFVIDDLRYTILSASTVSVRANDAFTLPSSLNIPNTVDYDLNSYSVISIEDNGFSYNSILNSVTIPSSVTYVGAHAFSSCMNLSSVTMPSSVTYFGDYAFSDCISLNSVIIPSLVTHIGDYAFSECTGLTSIKVDNAIPPSINASVFNEVDTSTCVLYVPIGSIASYEAADCWKDFTHIVEDATLSNNTTATQQKVYIINGKVIISGLSIGENITVCNIQGTAIYNQKADSKTININLPARGIYIIKVGAKSVKTIY